MCMLLQVDTDVSVQDVVPLFGPLVKYILNSINKDPAVPNRNVFNILGSQYELSQPKLSPFAEETTGIVCVIHFCIFLNPRNLMAF